MKQYEKPKVTVFICDEKNDVITTSFMTDKDNDINDIDWDLL